MPPRPESRINPDPAPRLGISRAILHHPASTTPSAAAVPPNGRSQPVVVRRREEGRGRRCQVDGDRGAAAGGGERNCCGGGSGAEGEIPVPWKGPLRPDQAQAVVVEVICADPGGGGPPGCPPWSTASSKGL